VGGFEKRFVGTCLAAKLDKSKKARMAVSVTSSFPEGNKKWFKVFFGLFVLNGKFGGDSPVVFKLYFQWQQGGVHSEKMVGNFSFFGYSQWKQKGVGGMLMLRSNPQLTIGNGP
jgi:hypothetical protein